jgi:hypothetical protein
MNTKLNKAESYLTWEVFLMGGASIISCLLAWIFFTDTASLASVATVAFALAFVANHPHFAASYTLLYGDFRQRIFKRPGYFWAAVIVPLILATALLLAWNLPSAALMGHIINAMYFFVGWHYAKQVFGCIIVTSVRRKIFYEAWERKLLLTSLFAIWFVSWTQNQTLNNDFQFYGIGHISYRLDIWLHYGALILFGTSVLAVIAMQVRRYKTKKQLPSPPGVAAYLALAVWFLPKVSPVAFAYMIPLFHSVQYLTFVWVLKKNETAFEIRHLKDRAWRVAWAKKVGGYALMATVLGALFFEFIPRALDSTHYTGGDGFGAEPFMALFLLFINIHHYFIDNVIWKSNNETVKKFLFQPMEIPAQRASSPRVQKQTA